MSGGMAEIIQTFQLEFSLYYHYITKLQANLTRKTPVPFLFYRPLAKVRIFCVSPRPNFADPSHQPGFPS